MTGRPRMVSGSAADQGRAPTTPLAPTVLLADANADAQAMMRDALLEGTGPCQLRTVESAQELESYLRDPNPANPKPALVLIDLHEEGLEALTRIKRDADLRHIPVVGAGERGHERHRHGRRLRGRRQHGHSQARHVHRAGPPGQGAHRILARGRGAAAPAGPASARRQAARRRPRPRAGERPPGARRHRRLRDHPRAHGTASPRLPPHDAYLAFDLATAAQLLAGGPLKAVLLLDDYPTPDPDAAAAEQGVFVTLLHQLERALNHAIAHQNALHKLAKSEQRHALAMQGAEDQMASGNWTCVVSGCSPRRLDVHARLRVAGARRGAGSGWLCLPG